MRNFSRGTQVAIRLAILATVNAGVYYVYVKAISSAKASGVHGSFHRDGHLQYDDIVGSSYRNYATTLQNSTKSTPKDDEAQEPTSRTNTRVK